jgi:hypothetical protein
MKKITINARGNILVGDWFDRNKTKVSGINPIIKFIELDIVAESAKISGRTYILLNIPDPVAIDSAPKLIA